MKVEPKIRFNTRNVIDLILDQLMLRDFSHWILIELIDSLYVKVAEDSIEKRNAYK